MPRLTYMSIFQEMTKYKIIFKAPKVYRPKVLEFKRLNEEDNPILFIENFCNLKRSRGVIIIHKSLKLAAEFEMSNKILIDFHNSLNYIYLCLAHEYTHILLRNKISIPYPFEQSLAILLQLTYEDYAKIREFSQKTAEELMKLMNVWPVGKILLKKWPSYWHPKTGRNNKYSNILIWLKKNYLKFENDKKYHRTSKKDGDLHSSHSTIQL